MPLEQQVPQELVALAVQALADHQHPAAQGDLADLRIAERGRPGVQPCAGGGGIVHRVVERGHQVRLTKAALADHHDRTPLVRANRLDPLQQVVGRDR